MHKSLHDARVAAGVSQLTIAAAAGVAIGTVRAFELDPMAVREPKRAATRLLGEEAA
jgi:hypothetical protein